MTGYNFGDIILLGLMSTLITQEGFVMRVTKKIMALALSLVMLVSTMITGSALTFSDVTDNTRYSDAINSMVALGLLAGYPDGTFGPDRTITRAEFAAVMTRAIGMEALVGGASSSAIFTDMEGHWATGYVKIAYDRGIILGMGDGTFAPDSPVTYEQVVKMIVCALGREQAAINKGGWPNGYLADASDIELTVGAIQGSTNTPASRGIVAQLVFNSLEIRIMESSKNGNMVQTNKTLLNDMLKVTKFTNMLVSEVDGVLSINAGQNKAREGEIVLESGLNVGVYDYKNVITSPEARDFLGLYVSGYYKQDKLNDKNVLLSISSQTKNNTELILASEDIERLSSFTLRYWKDKESSNRTESITISPTAKLIYNGVAYAYLSSGDSTKRDLTYWLDPSGAGFINGEVRMLDSGADGVYDSLFIDDYETYVVKSAVTTNDSTYSNNYVIYDYYQTGKNIQIDPYDRNITVDIYNAKTNKEVKIESLKAMDILSVAASSDHSIIKCYVSTDVFSGSIISTKGSNPKLYCINNEYYELTREFEQVVNAGKVSMEIGSSGRFYLDKTGKIAAASITEAQTGNYVYITAAGKHDIIGENAAIEMIALSGSPSTPTKYKVSNSARINNRTCTSTTEILDALQNSAALLASNSSSGTSNSMYSQLAKVVINSSGEVSAITTVATNESGNLDVGNNVSSGKLKIGQTNRQYRYSDNSGFESQVFIDSSTQVLVVPSNRRDADKYKRSTGSRYFTAGRDYTIEAFDMNSSATAKVVIVYGDEADIAITSDTPASLVISCVEIISEITGSRAYSLEVYENGEIKTYETEDSSSTYALDVGDVARFGFNSSGQINSVSAQVDASNLVPATMNGTLTDENGEYRFKAILGTVVSLVPDRIIIAPAFVDDTATPPLVQDNREGYAINQAVKVYRVNTNTGNIESNVDINSIFEFGDMAINLNASKVYAYALSGDLKMVVIYQ